MPWKFANVELFGVVLAHGAEDEEEVPDTHADLDAVGVAVAVVVGRLVSVRVGWSFGWLGFCDFSLSGSRRKIWCERGDLNPHGLLRQNLNLVRLPISPLPRRARCQPLGYGKEGSIAIRGLRSG